MAEQPLMHMVDDEDHISFTWCKQTPATAKRFTSLISEVSCIDCVDEYYRRVDADKQKG